MIGKIKDKLKWIDPFFYTDKYLMPKINPEDSSVKANIIYIVIAFVSAWVLYTGLGLLLGTASPLVIVVSGSMEPVYFRGDVILLTGVSASNLNLETIDLGNKDIEGKAISEYLEPICEIRGTNERDICSRLILNSKSKLTLNDITTVALKFNETNQEIILNTKGAIVVYDSDITFQPIIHRAIAKLESNGKKYVLTKGDSENNPFIDQYFFSLPGVQISGFSSSAIPIENLKGKGVIRVPIIGYVKLILFDDIPRFITGLIRG